MNWDKLILETYNLLYEASYPKVSFNDLRNNCLVYENEHFERITLEKALTPEECISMGYKRVINYYAYYLPIEIQDKIIKEQIKKYKIKKADISNFKMSVCLGCGPTCSQKRWIEWQEENNTGLTLENLNNWVKETYPEIKE